MILQDDELKDISTKPTKAGLEKVINEYKRLRDRSFLLQHNEYKRPRDRSFLLQQIANYSAALNIGGVGFEALKPLLFKALEELRELRKLEETKKK